MNNTNRALNRIGILVFGLVLVAVGGAVAAAALLPDALAAWTAEAERASGQLDMVTAPNGLLLAVGVAAVLIALLIVFIARQGRGQTATLLTKTGDGCVVVSSALAAQTIGAALAEYSGAASASVTAFTVRGVPALKIAVAARRGASPRDIRDHVDILVARWDDLLGEQVPVFIRINGGIASRLAKPTRLPVAGRGARDERSRPREMPLRPE
ncbi:hypothetical protein [Cryobacterium roopkundense]|uniref:Alkaline shock response membrane anchor protein AmaP n=1 Tax=Cryobacterium roopkundense TaxID=1001240 RepID=A0A7W8ZYW6_9MICO|nr:hypothetical protein [Cryobacterium roopkundense]MBB5642465.1 hypothetical protein [Cryobacterium roopkundense]